MINLSTWTGLPGRAWRVTAGVTLALTLTLQAPLTAGAEVSTAPAASASQQAAGQSARTSQLLLFTVRGTPHEWLRDEQGVFHWVGDSTALNRRLYPPNREYTINDPLGPALRRSLDNPEPISFEQLMSAPRGEPLVSNEFIEHQGAFYYPRWPALDGAPEVLRLASTEDLAIFGVNAENRGRLVISAEEWQRRHKLDLEELELARLRPAGPERPSAMPCMPIILTLAPVTNGAQAEVHNPCDGARRAWISAVLYDAPGGRPLATTSTSRSDLAAGETRTVEVTTEVRRSGTTTGTTSATEAAPPSGTEAPPQGPPPQRGRQPQPRTPINPGWVQPYVNSTTIPNWVPAATNAPNREAQDAAIQAGRSERFNQEDFLRELCLDVGAVGCLHVDPRLRESVEVLRRISAGPEVLAAAADWGVTISYGPLFGALGAYESRTRSVTIGAGLEAYSDWERAMVLVHELQHAMDHAQGRLPTRTAVECLARERDAFNREAVAWRELWGGQFPEPRGEVQESLNAVSTRSADDPEAFSRALTLIYRPQCDR